ncbi:MAG: hypothetical protein MUF75_01120 [Bacteroidia bacterium]|jgi:hypothetical protein|nr:hypothetical protein [Bacteroidia bacterium]
MKLVIALLLISTAVDSTIKDLRKHYALVGVNEGHVSEMLNLSKNSNDPTVMAYAAGAEMASAQYKFSPLSKLSAFNSGKAKLEPIIKANPENVEARFIRYTIQLKCPAMLGYNREFKSDRAYILGELPGLKNKEPELYKYILAFMLIHDKLSAEEKAALGLN